MAGRAAACAGRPRSPRRMRDGLLASWLDALAPGGGIVMPLTVSLPGMSLGKGVTAIARRDGTEFEARVLHMTMIYTALGIRDPGLEPALGQAMRGFDFMAVRRLRRDPHEKEPACWLAGCTGRTSACLDDERAVASPRAAANGGCEGAAGREQAYGISEHGAVGPKVNVLLSSCAPARRPARPAAARREDPRPLPRASSTAASPCPHAALPRLILTVCASRDDRSTLSGPQRAQPEGDARGQWRLRQNANPMTYRPVPVADERHRPAKASLPQRRCVRPKGPGRVWEKRRQESIARQHHMMTSGRRPRGARRRVRPSAGRTASSRRRLPRRYRTGC